MYDLITSALFVIYYSGFIVAIVIATFTIKVQKPTFEKDGIIIPPDSKVSIAFTIFMGLLSWVAVIYLIADFISFFKNKGKQNV